MSENFGEKGPNFSATTEILNKMQEKSEARSQRSGIPPQKPLSPDDVLKARAHLAHLRRKMGLAEE